MQTREGAHSRLLAHRGFRLLLIGQAISGLGDWMGTVALMALVLQLTGSSTAVGGILVLRLAPATIAGPLATRATSKWNRQRTMLTMDLARAAMVAVLPLISAIWWIYTWAFLIEVASLVFLPARDAAVPELVDDEALPVANGMVMGSSYGMIPVGAGVFAAISALVGAGGHGHLVWWIVFLVDAATFLASFACVARIQGMDQGPVEPVSEERTSFRAALRIPEVQAVGPAALVIAIGLGALFSLGIVFVRDVLHASDTDFAVLIALFGAGAAIGLLIVRRVRGPRMRAVRLAVLAQGITVGVMSLSPDVQVAFLGAVCFGAATTVALTAGVSELQERLEGRERVMAFAVFHVTIRGGLAAAAVAAGVTGDVLSGLTWPIVGHLAPARVVLLCSGIVVALAGALMAPSARLGQRFERARRAGGSS